MSLNLLKEGELEQVDGLDHRKIVLDVSELMKKEIEIIVIKTFETMIAPTMEDLISKIVGGIPSYIRNEILRVGQTLKTSGDGNTRDETSTPVNSANLQLKFLDEVALPVLTGMEIKSKEGTDMRLAVVDDKGEFVNSGTPKLLQVEALIQPVNDDDNEHERSSEDFSQRIVRQNDKTKPYFSKSIYGHLKEGIGFLSGMKLGHSSSWMKSCKCRLGARVVDSVGGTVREAWTEPFLVEDRRNTLYKKHHPPSLQDEVWRLENIGRDGEPCKRLHNEKIQTVEDLLFFLYVDPQKLQDTLNMKKDKGSKKWNAIVEHAQTCIIDDEKIYIYGLPSNFEFSVVFRSVANLWGIIRNSNYVPLNDLSDNEKARAKELLYNALYDREGITSVVDESSFLIRYPHEPMNVNTPLTIPEYNDDVSNIRTIPECYGEHVQESGQNTNPFNQTNDCNSLVYERTENLCSEPLSVHGEVFIDSNNGFDLYQESTYRYEDLGLYFWGNQFLPRFTACSTSVEPSDQQNSPGNTGLNVVLGIILLTRWVSRTRKKRFTMSESDLGRKRIRTC